MRFSTRDPGCYAITVMSETKKVKHYRVYHKPGLKYLIGKTEVDSLQEVISKYGKELGAIHPCPGWPYEKLFQTTRISKPSISEGYLMPDFS